MEERFKLFCSRFRKELKLSGFRLRRSKCKSLRVIAPSGNEWTLGYLELNTWNFACLYVVCVANNSRMKIESEIASSHANHVLSVLRAESLEVE
jgi:hypothetical protein